MSVWETIRRSYGLLGRRDQKKLRWAVLAQMMTAFLDLLGVFLLGLVAALSTTVVTGTSLPPTVSSLMSKFGLAQVTTVTLIGVIAAIAGAALIAKSMLSFFLTRRVLRFLANRQAVLSGQLAASVLEQPLLRVEARSSQETAFILTEGVSAATLGVLGQSVAGLTEIALLTVLTLGLLVVDPWVTVFSLVFFGGITLALQRVMAGWASDLGRRGYEAQVESVQVVQEAVRAYREVSVSDRRNLYVARFQDLRRRMASVQADYNLMGLIPKYLLESAMVVGAFILAGSQFLLKDVTAAVTSMALVLVASSRVVPSLLRLQSAALVVRSSSGTAAQTFVLVDELKTSGSLDVEVKASDRKGWGEVRTSLLADHGAFDASIALEGVAVTYPGSSRRALFDVSISVPAGTSLGIVGPTGAGKSTLTDVLLGIVHPERGRVLIGGEDPSRAVAKWPGALAYVPQQPAVVDGTIRENLVLGVASEAIDDGRAWEALRRARLAEFLEAQREGLETVVGEQGVRLSGGQRQRLGIARALYTRPRLLVLDEATSSLDAETERAIVETLQDLEGKITTVTIAHRLATIRHCAQVAYLMDGILISVGSFDQVRRDVPAFDQQARLLGL